MLEIMRNAMFVISGVLGLVSLCMFCFQAGKESGMPDDKKFWWIQFQYQVKPYQLWQYNFMLYTGPSPAHWLLTHRKDYPDEIKVIIACGELTEEQYKELDGEF